MGHERCYGEGYGCTDMKIQEAREIARVSGQIDVEGYSDAKSRQISPKEIPVLLGFKTGDRKHSTERRVVGADIQRGTLSPGFWCLPEPKALRQLTDVQEGRQCRGAESD